MYIKDIQKHKKYQNISEHIKNIKTVQNTYGVIMGQSLKSFTQNRTQMHFHCVFTGLRLVSSIALADLKSKKQHVNH